MKQNVSQTQTLKGTGRKQKYKVPVCPHKSLRMYMFYVYCFLTVKTKNNAYISSHHHMDLGSFSHSLFLVTNCCTHLPFLTALTHKKYQILGRSLCSLLLFL